MTRRASPSPAPARPVRSRDLTPARPSVAPPATLRPAERPPAVRVEPTPDGGLALVGPDWSQQFCRVCLGRTTTVRLMHARPCVHCGATGFEPSNPHSAGWGLP